MSLLEDQVAVVTGGSSGIGAVTCRRLANRGARVVLAADSNVEGGREVEQSIRTSGGEATFVRADVRRESDVQSLLDETVDRYGPPDILFNNAGINGETVPITDYGTDVMEDVLAVNVKGVWLGMKHAIPLMQSSGGGSIINTSSIIGVKGYRNRSAYCASKAAVVGMSKSVALEVAEDDIRVNALVPGAVLTPMVEKHLEEHPEWRQEYEGLEPMPGMTKPEEVAAAVVFLGSAESRRITGTVFPVDGGFLAS